jgi:hypothetical protein
MSMLSYSVLSFLDVDVCNFHQWEYVKMLEDFSFNTGNIKYKYGLQLDVWSSKVTSHWKETTCKLVSHSTNKE